MVKIVKLIKALQFLQTEGLDGITELHFDMNNGEPIWVNISGKNFCLSIPGDSNGIGKPLLKTNTEKQVNLDLLR
jgi:hypothetical protein